MKGFVRNNQYLSLCGLNCKLCPMNLTGHCSGCGVDNQSCKIAKCSIEHGKIEYCFQCTSFPCDKYAHIDDFDSFITHHNQMNDMEKASQIGIPAYNAEQEEKRKLLDFLLSHYNDGRRKNLFCVAVNLLTIKEIENILQTVKSDKDFQSMGKKEQASVIAKLLQDIQPFTANADKLSAAGALEIRCQICDGRFLSMWAALFIFLGCPLPPCPKNLHVHNGRIVILASVAWIF